MLGVEEMTEQARRKVKARVNRIGGQVAGISRMINEDKYCVDILNQIAAARSALDALGVELLTEHVESCVIGHGCGTEHECAKPMTQEALVAEVRTALSRFLKS
jgi:DNA-binding FrmR family transcriptional regulator